MIVELYYLEVEYLKKLSGVKTDDEIEPSAFIGKIFDAWNMPPFDGTRML